MLWWTHINVECIAMHRFFLNKFYTSSCIVSIFQNERRHKNKIKYKLFSKSFFSVPIFFFFLHSAFAINVYVCCAFRVSVIVLLDTKKKRETKSLYEL